MSDQGRWAKIWIGVLSNPELENLELHQWARWVRLIIFMKAHGTNGKLSFKPPFRALQNVLRVTSFMDLKELIINLPNFKWFEPLPNASHTPFHEDIGKHMITCSNWFKYQGDMSVDRMKKLRKKRSVTPTVTCDSECDDLRGEEKRRITSTSTSPTTSFALRSPLERGGATRENGGKGDAAWPQSMPGNLSESEPQMASPEEVKEILQKFRRDTPRGG